MPKLPHVTSREIIRACERAGYVKTRQKGSHLHLHKDGKRITVRVTGLNENNILQLIRDLGITKEQFITLLKGK